MIHTALVKVDFCNLKCILKLMDRSKWTVSGKSMIEWTVSGKSMIEWTVSGKSMIEWTPYNVKKKKSKTIK